MRTVSAWMMSHGLLMALNKKEIAVLIKKISDHQRVGEEMVKTKPAAKYFGVLIDSKLCFWEQTEVCAFDSRQDCKRLYCPEQTYGQY